LVAPILTPLSHCITAMSTAYTTAQNSYWSNLCECTKLPEMVLFGSVLTWLSLTAGSVAVCRAAASGDGVRAGLDVRREGEGKEPDARPQLECERRGHLPSVSSPTATASVVRSRWGH